MENYTKYRLKDKDELVSVLAGKDNLFIIACNKCFKEFETIDEPECSEFEKLAAENGKTVTGSARVDFLCNKTQTENKLQDMIPEGTENIFVISCRTGNPDCRGSGRKARICGHQFTELYGIPWNGAHRAQM